MDGKRNGFQPSVYSFYVPTYNGKRPWRMRWDNENYCYLPVWSIVNADCFV